MVETPREVAWRIRSGDVIVASPGAAFPYAFLDGLAARSDLRGVSLYSAQVLATPDWMVRRFRAEQDGQAGLTGFRFLSFALGPGDREAWERGLVDLVPVGGRRVRDLFLHSGRMNAIALGAAGPDEQGTYSLGTNVDWVPDLLHAAEELDALVIVEANRQMPRTCGDTSFPADLVDHVIEVNRALPEYVPPPPRPEDRLIAAHVADLVPDEATLAAGLGGLVDHVVRSLARKRNLGVHSDLLTDAFLFLHEQGALTNRRKGRFEDRWVGSSLYGTQRLYAFAHDNPRLHLASIDQVTAGTTLAELHRFVALSGALEVDLLGQVAGDAVAHRQLSGPGCQRELHEAAARHPEGLGIVLLRSTRGGGRVSTIVPGLRPGSPVTIPRGDVDCVVTEHGVARLRGRGARERALALISVAHPDHQDGLVRQAHELGLL